MEKAATYLENLITAAEAAGHRLYEKYDNAGNLDVNQTLYLLFQNYTEEILWCTSNNDWSNNTKMENVQPHATLLLLMATSDLVRNLSICSSPKKD